MTLELVMLGSGAAFRVPLPFCTCAVCENARANPRLRRTRSSLAILGQQTTLIDAGPDFEEQIEREKIRRLDNILVTHWHYDHIAGLAALGELAMFAGWAPVHIYLPASAAHHFDEELAYTRRSVAIHPVSPGDTFVLPDARVEVFKTTHNAESQGYLLDRGTRWAYLGDGVVPPPESLERLRSLELVFLEATVDDLDVAHWGNQSLSQAVALWRQLGARRCILTHLSDHKYLQHRLSQGLLSDERAAWAARYPGLEIGNDGLRTRI
ncbi:MAG: MBL fold metallo-hydrolase [Anaerolineae bacterium]